MDARKDVVVHGETEKSARPWGDAPNDDRNPGRRPLPVSTGSGGGAKGSTVDPVDGAVAARAAGTLLMSGAFSSP